MPGLRTQSEDTSLEVEQILISTWRNTPPWEKARQVNELIQMTRDIVIAGIRARHPNASDEEVQRQLMQLFATPDPS